MVDTSRKNSANPGILARPLEDRRRIVDRGWDHNRYPPVEDAMGARSPPKTVERALREDCHIEAKEYFLATVASDGGVNYFISSPERLGQRDIGNIFNEPQFRRVLNADGPGRPSMSSQEEWREWGSLTQRPAANSIEPSGFHENTQVMGGRSYNRRSPGTTSPHQARRRGRTNANRRNVPDDTMPPPAKRIPLMIGNSDAVWQFYINRFKGIQQTACKLIAKAWIKTVAPKKQSTHPYTGQEIPAWWPRPWGKTPFDAVRHKEPDHLKKHERIPLCAHILRLVIEPNERQHPDIQRLHLTVAKLEEITRDALSLFFSENANNQAKRPCLQELMKVAKMEEKYKRGEIGANTDVLIMPLDRMPVMEDDDDEEEEGSASPASIPTEGNLSIMIHSQSTQTTAIPGLTSMMPLPSPSPHYGAGALTSAMGPEQSAYMENSTAMDIDENPQGQHGPSRRTSTYSSPASEYASSLGPVSLYPSTTVGPTWQQTTSAPASGSVFAYSHNQMGLSLPPPHSQSHAQAHSSGYVSQMDVQVGQHQYIGSHFEGQPNPNALFRNTGANSGHGPTTPGYGQRGYGH